MSYRIIPTAVSESPAGTATRTYVAWHSDGGRWFVKAYPAGTDLGAERQALELGQFTRIGCLPVRMVWQPWSIRHRPIISGVQVAEGSSRTSWSRSCWRSSSAACASSGATAVHSRTAAPITSKGGLAEDTSASRDVQDLELGACHPAHWGSGEPCGSYRSDAAPTKMWSQ